MTYSDDVLHINSSSVGLSYGFSWVTSPSDPISMLHVCHTPLLRAWWGPGCGWRCVAITASTEAGLRTALMTRAAAALRSCVGLACPGQMSAVKFQDQAWRLGEMDRDESGAVSEPPASSRSDARKPAPDQRSSDRSRDNSRESRRNDSGKDDSRRGDGSKGDK